MTRSSKVLAARVMAFAVALAAVSAIAIPCAAADVGRSERHCAHMSRIVVPGAQFQRTACLDDMTTFALAHTDYTNPANYRLQVPSATVLPRDVPGIQVDGYFPDTYTFNTNHGWNHDAQFVIRLPDHWNGRLVITGAPGVLTQYTQDPNISDKVISEGYAYASTDKGNGGSTFYTDGTNPGDALVEWNQRVTQLAIAAKATMVQRYGRRARFTYITGVSNGGYFARWELENHPELFDGGVDWEGTLFNTTGHNLLDYLPVALRASTRNTVPRVIQRRIKRCSPPASPQGRSTCGTSTTPTYGTTPNACCARRSTRAGTEVPRLGIRSASPGLPTATPTTSSRSGRTGSRRWREWRCRATSRGP